MSRPEQTFHVLTPTYKPVGGVVKILDYATHAQALGYRISLWCPQEHDPDLPLFRMERFRSLLPDGDRVVAHSDPRLAIGPDDLAFVSLPINVLPIHRSLPRGYSPERTIHIIQNVRHVNPTWEGGQPLRLLARPLARISTNQIVHDAVAPYTDQRSLHRIIPLGHDLGYFHRDRTDGPHTPLRVAYTAWKSDLGDRVAAVLGDDPSFTFRGVHDHVTWPTLRELYHWADVFLCCPNPEEGFYMPGLEAMEAGAIVVTPDVGGNMAYCRPDVNCVLVGHEDVDDVVAALGRIRGWSDEQVREVRAAGYDACAPFDLAKERRLFEEFLDELWPRIRAYEAEVTA